MTYAKRFILLTTLTIVILTLLISNANASNRWADWPEDCESILSYVQDNNLLFGYPDGTYKPHKVITQRQVVLVVCERAGLRTDLKSSDFKDVPATMQWVEENFLPNTVFSASPSELCTRFRFALMLQRNAGALSPLTDLSITQTDTASILDTWFSETIIKGIQSRLVGTGYLWVRLSQQYNVPLWFALGQCYAESQFFTTGLAGKGYNVGFGIKGGNKWGDISGKISGFANYISVEESITAYFKLIGTAYKNAVDEERWKDIISRYAPPSDGNNVGKYYGIILSIKNKCKEKGIITN